MFDPSFRELNAGHNIKNTNMYISVFQLIKLESID